MTTKTKTKKAATLDAAKVIAEIRGRGRLARFARKQQMRLEQALRSHVVFVEIGADPADKADLKKKYGQASEIIKDILKEPLVQQILKAHKDGLPTKSLVDQITNDLWVLVIANDRAVLPFKEFRAKHENAMEKLAQTLPVWTDWGLVIRGFGAFGLSQIIAECGDLSNYSTVSKLWKRLGLAVMEGKRQGRPGEGATKETWIAHGYNAERRAVIWNIGQSLLKGQSEAKDEETGVVVREAGHYRAIYDGRKVYEMARVPSKGHAHNRATRYVEKMLIADLWSAWRKTTRVAKPIKSLSSAKNCDGGEAPAPAKPNNSMPSTITTKSKKTKNCGDGDALGPAKPRKNLRPIAAIKSAAKAKPRKRVKEAA